MWTSKQEVGTLAGMLKNLFTLVLVIITLNISEKDKSKTLSENQIIFTAPLVRQIRMINSKDQLLVHVLGLNEDNQRVLIQRCNLS